VNYDLSLVVSITVTCYLRTPFTGDYFIHLTPSPGATHGHNFECCVAKAKWY